MAIERTREQVGVRFQISNRGKIFDSERTKHFECGVTSFLSSVARYLIIPDAKKSIRDENDGSKKRHFVDSVFKESTDTILMFPTLNSRQCIRYQYFFIKLPLRRG